MILISLISGCGEGTELASVEGTVTMDGKPLPNATVVFVNSKSRPSAARKDAKGFYRLSSQSVNQAQCLAKILSEYRQRREWG